MKVIIGLVVLLALVAVWYDHHSERWACPGMTKECFRCLLSK